MGKTVNTKWKDTYELQRKELRATTYTLPFEKLPHLLIVEIAYNAVIWLSCFPHKNYIHATLSPQTIITGSKIDFNKHCSPEEINSPSYNNAEVTGVNNSPGNAENKNLEITGVDTTGVWVENTQQNTAEVPENVQDDRGEQQDSTAIPQMRKKMKSENTPHPEEEEISIKNESPEDAHVTLNDIKLIERMNTAQLKMDPETGN